MLPYKQYDNESLYKTWERFQGLLRKCPHYGLPIWLQVDTFYHGLGAQLKMMVDVASGGASKSNLVDDGYEFIDNMQTNSYNWRTKGTTQSKTVRVHESDTIN